MVQFDLGAVLKVVGDPQFSSAKSASKDGDACDSTKSNPRVFLDPDTKLNFKRDFTMLNTLKDPLVCQESDDAVSVATSEKQEKWWAEQEDLMLWHVSIVLLKYFLDSCKVPAGTEKSSCKSNPFEGKNILELGAGLGHLGFVLSNQLGANVICTEREGRCLEMLEV